MGKSRAPALNVTPPLARGGNGDPWSMTGANVEFRTAVEAEPDPLARHTGEIDQGLDYHEGMTSSLRRVSVDLGRPSLWQILQSSES